MRPQSVAALLSAGRAGHVVVPAGPQLVAELQQGQPHHLLGRGDNRRCVRAAHAG